MSFSATRKHPKEKAWSREHEYSNNPKGRSLEFTETGRKESKIGQSSQHQGKISRERGKETQHATSRSPDRPAASGPAPGVPGRPSTIHLPNTRFASSTSSETQETPYARPVPGTVVYSQHAVRSVSGAQIQATTRPSPTTPSHTPYLAHSTHITHPGSIVSNAGSFMSTSSAAQLAVPPEHHSYPPHNVSSPGQNSNSPRTPSVVSVAPSTASGRHPAVLPSRDSSRAPSAVGAPPSRVSEIYPSLPPSRDSSCAAQSRVPESTTPASESRLLTYRAPSVVTVTSSTISDQHPLLPASTASSVIHSLQPSRSQSVASAARNTVSEDRRVSPTPVSRSPSIVSTTVSVNNEFSGHRQESHSRNSSRAPSLQAPSSRALSSRAPSSRTASVAPSIRSEHISSTVSAARLQADEEYANSVISCGPSEVESSVRSRRPSDVLPSERYTSSVSERAPIVAASTRTTIKSGRSERDSSIASKARSHIYGNDYESDIQSMSSSKRVSSIKPSQSERGISSASKVRTHIDVNDHESSSEREPTSRRASSKASSFKSSRKASRDDRGRSTTSRTTGSCNELAEVRVTYDEHEEARPRSQSRYERSRSVSTHRSSSVSSTGTVRPPASKHTALVVYHDNAVHTAEASKDNVRLRSSRRKKKPDIDVRSYVGSDNVTVVLPDPSEVGGGGRASGSQDQQKQRNYREEYQEWQRQEQQHQQRYQQRQPNSQPYPQPYSQSEPHTYPFQYPQQQQAHYPTWGTPGGYPQYTNYQYPNQQYPNPRYTHPPPTAQSYYPTADASYSPPYVTPTPQYGTGYERLGEELEQGRKSGRLPKARDKRREKVGRSSRTTRLEEEYEESPLVYERGDRGKFPKKRFD